MLRNWVKTWCVVIMCFYSLLRGIVQKWKMPVSYYVTNSNVQANTIKCLCISALNDIRLNIRSVWCDQSWVNRNVVQLGVNETAVPILLHWASIRFTLWLPPHDKLHTEQPNETIYQLWVRHNKCIMGQADWEYVVSLLNIESSTVRAIKLMQKHLCPNNFEKMSVKLASQMCVPLWAQQWQQPWKLDGQLPKEAKRTAYFIKN